MAEFGENWLEWFEQGAKLLTKYRMGFIAYLLGAKLHGS